MDLDLFDINLLLPEELEWELKAREIAYPSSTEEARGLLGLALESNKPLIAVQGSALTVRDDALQAVISVRGSIEMPETLKHEAARLFTFLKHHENRLNFTRDPRDSRGKVVAPALREVVNIRQHLRSAVSKSGNTGAKSKSPPQAAALSGPQTLNTTFVAPPLDVPDVTNSDLSGGVTIVVTPEDFAQQKKQIAKLEQLMSGIQKAFEKLTVAKTPQNLFPPHIPMQNQSLTQSVAQSGVQQQALNPVFPSENVQQLQPMSQLMIPPTVGQQSAGVSQVVTQPVNQFGPQPAAPPSNTTGQPNLSSSPRRQSDFWSEIQSIPFVNRRLKPLQVKDWGLKFSGNRSERTAKSFLRDVERMAHIQGVSLQEVVWSMRLMLTDGAQLWYDTYSDAFRTFTWEQFRERFLSAFCNLESDFEIRRKIEERKQGAGENAEVFLAAMLTLFDELVEDIPEAEKIRLIRRNLHFSVANALLLFDITSLADLSLKLKVVEKNRSYAYQDRTRRTERHLNAISGFAAQSSEFSGYPGEGSYPPLDDEYSDEDLREESFDFYENPQNVYHNEMRARPHFDRNQDRNRNQGYRNQGNRNTGNGYQTNRYQGNGYGRRDFSQGLANPDARPEEVVCVYCKKNGHRVKHCKTRPKYVCFKCGKSGTIFGLCPVCNPNQGEAEASQ